MGIAITVLNKGYTPYQHSYDAMRIFTQNRQRMPKCEGHCASSKEFGLLRWSPASKSEAVYTEIHNALTKVHTTSPKIRKAMRIESDDQIWLVQHPPVYTLGQAGKPEHLLKSDTGIPLIKTDRGGQITYHGPGQLVAYLLIDLVRRQLKVREFVSKIETAIIDTLFDFDILAQSKPQAPGVYVHNKKIAALGLKISRGYSYHGLSLNHQMDLTPFTWINPCGDPQLHTTDLSRLGVHPELSTVQTHLVHHLQKQLNY